MNNKTLWIPTVLSAAILAACGGGGSSDTAQAGGAAALTLTGVAATGAAIIGKTVDAKCATGTGSATSTADGSYSISVVSGTLPCVLKVTPDSGVALYSVATGTGSEATANISPVTQLVVASLTGTDPEAYFASFDSTAAAAVTSANVATAVSDVKTTLLAAGVDLGTIDVLAGTLTPATSSTAGNAYDQALDALAVQITAGGTSLATLSTSVAAASTIVPPTVAVANSGTPSLPAELLLKPAAATCAALRSGTYRVVNPARNAPMAELTGKIVVDAAALTVIFTDGSAGSLVPHATEACRFTDADDGAELVVSPAGVLVARSPNGDGTFSLSIGFPEQARSVAELAGDWNAMGLTGTDTGAFAAAAGTGTLNASGAFTSGTWCQNAVTWGLSGTDCVVEATNELDTLSLNPDGGFDSR